MGEQLRSKKNRPDRASEISALCDEFAAALRRGDSVTVEQFVALYPHCASQLRPALHAVCSLLSLAPTNRLPRDGDVIGDYRIVRLLARGGMGIVYEAEQCSTSRRVALKVLARPSDDDSTDQAMAVRFENEIRACASLDHPHIVPILDAGRSARLQYFAMPLIDGTNWSHWNGALRRPSRSSTANGLNTTQVDGADTSHESRRRQWNVITANVRDIACALHHAHERGVVHRDIKPSNLLRDSHGKVWIADFGLASFPTAASVTATGDLIGTLRYMSPEQARHGSLSVDSRSDIYSLGATFYEMLTGTFLVPPEQRTDQLRHIMAGKFVPPRRIDPQIPRSLETILLKMLAYHASDRYQQAGELARDLDRWLSGKTIRARRLSWRQRLIRSARNRMGLVLGATTALTVLTLVLGLLVGQLLRTRAELRERLIVSHLAEARAHVTSNKMGQRFRALQSIAQAATSKIQADDATPTALALKHTAATALSLRDARVMQTIPRSSGGSLDSAVFSHDLSYCTREADGVLDVVEVATQHAVARLPLKSYAMTVCFSHDGRKLYLLRGPEAQPTLEGWDWEKEQELWHFAANDLPSRPCRFALDVANAGDGVAIGLDSGKVLVLHPRTGELVQHLQGPESAIGQVKFSNNGRWLAASFIKSQKTLIWDWRSGEPLAEWKHTEDTFAVGWSRDDRWIAVGTGFDVNLYRTRDWPHEPFSRLTGSHEIIANISFHPSGRWLSVYDYNGTTRLWDCDTNSMFLELSGHANVWGESGDRLAFRTYDALGIWQLAFDDIVWHQQDHDTTQLSPDSLAFFAYGRRLAVGGNTGVHVWDTDDRRRYVVLVGSDVTDLAAVPGTDTLFIACAQGLLRIKNASKSLLARNEPVTLAFPWDELHGEWLALPEGERAMMIAAAGNGSRVGVTTQSGGVGVIDADGTWKWLAEPPGFYRYVSVSDDGNFLAAAHHNNPDTTLWRLDGRPERIAVESQQGGAVVLGRVLGQDYLLSSESTRYRWWRLDGGRRPSIAFDVGRPSGYRKSSAAFGSHPLLALAIDSQNICMTDPTNGRECGTLFDGYQSDRIVHMQFDSACHRLAVALALQGFVVWELPRLDAELQSLRLPPLFPIRDGSLAESKFDSD